MTISIGIKNRNIIKMHIPYNTIEKIRDSIDLVNLVNEYTSLEKVGNELRAICPIHKESIASFNVNPEKQIFYCFGCGAGGGIIHFCEKMENLNFYDAVIFLCKKYDIKIPELEQFSKYYKLMSEISSFYHNNLTKNAVEYLNKRGIKEKTIKEFKIGYALDYRNSLLNHFKDNKKNLIELKLIKKKDNGYYNFFRGRIIFPIHSENGNILGFIGRSLEENQNYKYLFSPNSKIFKKSNALYGLYSAKEYIKKTKAVILVEGVTDFLSVWQSGIKNVVAVLGTSLSENQAKLINKYAGKSIALFDSDAAGLEATLKSSNILIGNGLEIEIVSLLNGEDPDSFLQKYGKKEFLKILHSKISLISFWKKMYKEKKSLPQKREFIVSIIHTISRVKDIVTKNLLIKEVENSFGVKIKDVKEERRIVYVEDSNDEEELLKIFLKNSEMQNFIIEKLDIKHLLNKGVKEVFESILFLIKEEKEISVLGIIDYTEDERAKKYIAKLVVKETKISKKLKEILPEETDEIKAEKIIEGLYKRNLNIKIQETIKRVKSGENCKEELKKLIKENKNEKK